MKLKKKFIFIGIGIVFILAIIAVVLWVSGVFSSDKEETNNNNNETVPNEVKEEKKLQIVDENSTSRPYAVMINNINVARPLQSGLQDAI